MKIRPYIFLLLSVMQLQAIDVATFKYADFMTSMGERPMRWGRWSKNDKTWLAVVRELFERNNPTQKELSASPRIPKIIHHIWLGSPFPKEYEKWRGSWIEHHPDWECMLWTDDNTKDLKLRNRGIFDSLKNQAQKSDVLRQELLYQYGGLYVDTDFECFAPFDVLHHCYDFYTSFSNVGCVELGVGIIASAPGHPIIDACIERIAREKPKGGRPAAIIAQTGEGLLTQVVMKEANLDDEGILLFPCSYFYPLPNNKTKVPLQQRTEFLKTESLAMHHWGCSWVKGK